MIFVGVFIGVVMIRPVRMRMIVRMLITVRVRMWMIMRVRVIGMTAVFLVNILDTGGDRRLGYRLRVQLPAQKKHRRRAEQGKQRNEPDQVEEVHAICV